MIKKKFSGFTGQQMELIARKMGFDGPMEKFNEFLAASPDKAAKLSRLTTKARDIVEGLPPKQMATGGVVTSINKTKTSAINTPEKEITPVVTSPVVQHSNQLTPTNSGQAGAAATATAAPVQPTSTAAQPTTTPAPQVQTATAADEVGQVVDQTQAAQGQVSQESQVEAATALPSSDATVTGQLTKLMSQFEGGNTPVWAAGAMRKAETMMAQRGLGSSSMAGSAITQAAMESTIAIAAQDAATFSQFEMQNLNNRQQARLQNAQAFLQMDLANLNNEQQTTLFKSQARIQSLFTDQAAENASRQFNATSQAQTDQFFANLKTQVDTFNSAQKNAMQMFETEQLNAVNLFNTEQKNARAQFNAQNRLIVDQANAKWRQEIATLNNANQNEANRINAQLATGLTTAAYNNLWQQERDLMAYAFTAAEGVNQRAHEVVLAKLEAKGLKDIQKSKNRAALGQAAGSLIASVVSGIFG